MFNTVHKEERSLSTLTLDLTSLVYRAAVGEGKYEELCHPVPIVVKQVCDTRQGGCANCQPRGPMPFSPLLQAVTCSRALQYICTDCANTSAHQAPSCIMDCWANNVTNIRPYCPVQPVVCRESLCTVKYMGKGLVTAVDHVV
jgi:hypothetical protein